MKKRVTKRILCMLVAAVLAAGLFTGCGGGNEGARNSQETTQGEGQQKPEENAPGTGEVKGKIVEWNWNQLMLDNLKKIVNEKYPEIEYEGVIVAHADYMQKLQSSLAAGTDVPDILLGESAFRGKLFALDINDSLEDAPYNLDRSGLIETVIPAFTGISGKIVGLDQQFCPAGFAYRRDLMKEYFGIEEPEEVAELIKDWDSFTAAGKTLQQKSGGKVFMMASIQDLLDTIKGQMAQEYINGKEIDATKRFSEVFNLATQIRDAGVPLGKFEKGTPAWNATYSQGNVLFYNLASWAAKTYIAGNDKDNGKGRWGLVKSPGENGFTLGGTAVGIYKNSKNKDAAWAYLNYIYNTKEGAGEMYKNMGYIYSFKAFYEGDDAPIKQPGFYDEYFKGQNIGQYYYEVISPTIKTETQTTYQSAVEQSYSTIIPLFLKDEKLGAQQAMEKFKEELKLKAPDATIK